MQAGNCIRAIMVRSEGARIPPSPTLKAVSNYMVDIKRLVHVWRDVERKPTPDEEMGKVRNQSYSSCSEGKAYSAKLLHTASWSLTGKLGEQYLQSWRRQGPIWKY